MLLLRESNWKSIAMGLRLVQDYQARAHALSLATAFVRAAAR